MSSAEVARMNAQVLQWMARLITLGYVSKATEPA
jgi:hypothetical protein